MGTTTITTTVNYCGKNTELKTEIKFTDDICDSLERAINDHKASLDNLEYTIGTFKSK